ncbi:hypothetical protein FE257_003963 [Aspergillus nanangensis]|uniref:Uncharacterized protein n=1 Tax=Aspergillus nanangensis TaxID=2582783 RepID=A0AAD4CRN9_ASPNN|nr:hypothetical protein FE257_003963 [Aspergillus nanangensis]
MTVHSIYTLLVPLTPVVLGKEDEHYDPALNYRPKNVTGLDYYYYPWRGSYYNGSVTFTISSIAIREDYNYDDEKLCSRLSNGYTYTFSYPGILGITPTEGKDERPGNTNTLNIILSTSYSNFTKYFTHYTSNSGMQNFDEYWVFQSIELDGVGGSPFRVLGTLDPDEKTYPGFRMNMSSCTEPVSWWDALWASEEWDDEGMGVQDPALTVTFDSHSSSFVLKGYIFAGVLHEEEEEQTLPIVAELAVEFRGRHDDARSDILNEGVPVTWTPTVGFGNNSKNLDYGTASSGVGYGILRGDWAWAVVGVVVGSWFL